MKVGVLALQGGVEEHVQHIEKLNHQAILVKKKEDLNDIEALILPGGESTTIGKLLKITGLDKVIKEKIEEGLKVWGTCAGMILLAKEIEGEEEVHLGVLDIKVKRNGFGTQIQSYKEKQIIEKIDKEREIELVFIRAPYITEVGEGVQILVKSKEKVVAARKNNIFVTAFHPELTKNLMILDYFLRN
ncbi:MAG: pyridoxal 5'-phosphate synthase glutaminase subunit PdxT [Clostridium sp.]|uniref:pyridoxal 5'-phosphate synthase glutaminase subunit PdxT n=1 Tax=Clostridium sp. TaxID=1506 RepID=UPI003F32FC6E